MVKIGAFWEKSWFWNQFFQGSGKKWKYDTCNVFILDFLLLDLKSCQVHWIVYQNYCQQVVIKWIIRISGFSTRLSIFEIAKSA